MSQIRFRFDGQPMNDTDTPAQVSLELYINDFSCFRPQTNALIITLTKFDLKREREKRLQNCKFKGFYLFGSAVVTLMKCSFNSLYCVKMTCICIKGIKVVHEISKLDVKQRKVSYFKMK